MPAVDKSVRLLRVASICFGLFWLPWPYLPRSDVIRSHSARAVRHYESRVLVSRILSTFVGFCIALSSVHIKHLKYLGKDGFPAKNKFITKKALPAAGEMW